MKNDLYKQMYVKYQEGLSLSQVAELFGITRQSVYAGFKRRSYQLRSKNERPFVIYDNKRFTLRNNGYFGCTTGNRELLHRYKYEKEVKPILEGWDIHHIDHDKTNNNIDNLVAIPKSVHTWLFSEGSNQYVKKTVGVEEMGVREHYVNQFIANKHWT